MSRWQLAGRTALVTGAGRGMGAALARGLVARGMRVVVADVDGDAADRLAGELGRSEALAAHADVTDLADVEAAVDAAVERFGGLDVVVANAGVTDFGTLAELDPARFVRVLDVNLLGVYHTLRAAVPELVRTGGYGLAMSSLAAAVHSPLQAHYTASKAGVAAMADSLRLELADTPARIGVAHPTFVATEMMAQTHADAAGAKLWGGNRGPFAMVSLEDAVAALLSAVERRARRVVIPRRLTPIVMAPGLFTPLMELLLRRYGAPDAVRLARGAATGTR